MSEHSQQPLECRGGRYGTVKKDWMRFLLYFVGDLKDIVIAAIQRRSALASLVILLAPHNSVISVDQLLSFARSMAAKPAAHAETNINPEPLKWSAEGERKP